MRNGKRAGASKQQQPGTASGRRRVPAWLVGILMLLWWFGGYGAVIYSLIEDRGPFTFLLRWQEALFGGSNILLAAGIAAIVIFLGPPFVIGRLQRLWPDNPVIADLGSQIRRASRSRAELTAESRARWDAADGAGKLRIARRTRNAGLYFAAASFIIALVVAVWTNIATNTDAGKPLTPVTMRPDAPIVLGNSSPWVHVVNGTPLLDGVFARDYSIRGHAYRDYYTPIVPPGWHSGGRIYLLERDDTIPRYHDAQDIADPPGALEGELSPGGPREGVADAFREAGYDVGPWTAVLKRDITLGGKIPGEDPTMNILIWGEGGLFAFVGLIAAFIGQRRLKRVQRGRGE